MLPFSVKLFTDASGMGDDPKFQTRLVKYGFAYVVTDMQDNGLILHCEARKVIGELDGMGTSHAEMLAIVAGLRAIPVYRNVEIWTDQLNLCRHLGNYIFSPAETYKRIKTLRQAGNHSKKLSANLLSELVYLCNKHVVTWVYQKRSSVPWLECCDFLANQVVRNKKSNVIRMDKPEEINQLLKVA